MVNISSFRRSLRLGLGSILLLPSLIFAQRPSPDALAQAIDSIAAVEQIRHPYAGMTVLVARGSEEAIVRAYGKANLEHDVPARAETVYDLKSIAKQFTAAAILQLVDRGKVSLEDELTKFFPDFPTEGNRITVRHLLNNTSGIRGWVSPEAHFPGHERIDFSLEEAIAQRQGSGLMFAPEEGMVYVGLNYMLLAGIVEKVSGQSFQDYLRERILAPLEMGSTAFCEHSSILPHRASGYRVADGAFAHSAYESIAQMTGEAGLCSNVLDLLRWYRGVTGGEVISEASLRMMRTPVTLTTGQQSDYGFGLSIHDFYGHPRVFHTGGSGGFSAIVAHYPEDSLFVTVLLNTQSIDARRIEQSIALAALGMNEAPDVALSPTEAAQYLGTYKWDWMEVEITPRGAGIQARFIATVLLNHYFGLELLHQGGGEFLIARDPSTRLTFTVNGGRASKLQPEFDTGGHTRIRNCMI
jgi:D-alanyl-D-alanine carboxypeptidase